MTVTKQNVFYERKPDVVPLTRMDAGRKIFDFLRQVALGHPYEGGEVLINKVAFAWAFGELFNWKKARVIPFEMDVTDTKEFKDDSSTKFYEEDTITVWHKKYGCYLKLVSE